MIWIAVGVAETGWILAIVSLYVGYVVTDAKMIANSLEALVNALVLSWPGLALLLGPWVLAQGIGLLREDPESRPMTVYAAGSILAVESVGALFVDWSSALSLNGIDTRVFAATFLAVEILVAVVAFGVLNSPPVKRYFRALVDHRDRAIVLRAQ